MKNFKYNFVGSYDISNLLKILNNKSTDDWEYWTVKQRKFKVHNQTKTIPLLLDERYGYTGEVMGSETKFYSKFQVEIANITNIISEKYGSGNTLGIEIAKLPKLSNIDTHTDKGISLLKNPRIHLVLQTNDDVIFKVDGESKNMKVGELWEINNSLEHSVYNDGNIDRIHMIIDYKKVNLNLF
mgnify:CR=1 FL=1